MGERIYLSPPDVGTHEETAALRALRSGWVAPQGPEVDAFERELAEFTHRRFAVGVASGTAALHLALLNVDVRPGDVVLTATMTFAATANAIVYTGAEPVFVDCDDSGNIDPALLAVAMADQHRHRRRVAAVVAVDMLGKIADYEAIERIANDYRVPVIADAAESLGSIRDGRPAGSFGVSAALSFNGNKVMTTSGGGALLTDDDQVARRARYLSTQARQPVSHYEHTEIGYNYRLSNLLAAVGRAQLQRLPTMIERRRELRARYRELISGMPGLRLFGDDDSPSTPDNCWLTSVIIDPDLAGFSAQELIDHLHEMNIEARPLWKPMHAQPVFADARSYLNGTSDWLFQHSASLPSGSSLAPDQWSRIADAVRCVLDRRVPA